MTSIDDLLADFDFLEDWEDRYRHLIDLGKDLPPLADEDRNAENKVRGCASQVWITSTVGGSAENPILHFSGDSDALIVKGLIAIAFMLFQDKPAADILSTDVAPVLQQLGLSEHLTPQRSNGFASMIARIKADAQAAIQASSSS
ncbi:MAG: SufE family protein [Alphaproteobacteria bacterium]|nr:SufE family protein [Alphaproteobacteria bacterium]